MHEVGLAELLSGNYGENKGCICSVIFYTTREEERGKFCFFYDFVVDEPGKLLYIFWPNATSRKSYSRFGDLVSFDSPYSSNQYNMKCAPFTRANHVIQSVFFGTSFLVNERIEYYMNGAFSHS
jgi:hypothetical protein